LQCIPILLFITTCTADLRQLSRARHSVTVSQSTTTCQTSDQQSAPDISHLSPHVQHQWHHAKNAHLGSLLVAPQTNLKVWWHCDRCPGGHAHEWEARIGNRTNSVGCPLCANRKVCQHNSLATKAPATAAQFSSKNDGTAHDYMVASGKKVIWQCEQGHEWIASISRRTGQQRGCPVCHDSRRSEPRKRQPVLTDSQHPMMELWDWELNAQAGLDPSKITCRSAIKPNWTCSRCPKGQPHRWQAPVHQLFSGTGCPYCSSHRACKCNSLQSLHPRVAAEWDFLRNPDTPDDCTASSNAEKWWQNDKRGSFQARICVLTYKRKQRGAS